MGKRGSNVASLPVAKTIRGQYSSTRRVGFGDRLQRRKTLVCVANDTHIHRVKALLVPKQISIYPCCTCLKKLEFEHSHLLNHIISTTHVSSSLVTIQSASDSNSGATPIPLARVVLSFNPLTERYRPEEITLFDLGAETTK